MKTSQKFLSLGILVIVISSLACIFIVNSCKKQKNTCDCETSDHFTASITLQDGTLSNLINCKYWVIQDKSNSSTFYNVVASERKAETMEFIQSILRSLGVSFDLQNTYGITLYFNKPVQSRSTLQISDCGAVSLFEIQGRKLLHRLFLRTNNQFIENTEYNVEVPGITANHLNYYLKNCAFKEYNNTSFLTINNPIPKFKLHPSIKSYHLKYQKTALKNIVPDGCGSPCYSGYSWDVCIQCPYANMEWVCNLFCQDPGGDASPLMVQILGNSQFASAFNLPLQYQFRDSILMKTEMGRRYILTYYYLSSDLVDKINFDMALNTAKVLTTFNDVMQKFADTTGHGNDTIINETDKIAYLQLLNMYKSAVTDSSSIEAINMLISDVYEMSNLNLKELLVAIRQHE